jgi:hypothetical protein
LGLPNILENPFSQAKDPIASGTNSIVTGSVL